LGRSEMFECLALETYLPLFSLSYPETLGIYLSHTLPSPRSLLGVLARGLGILFGLGSEQPIQKGLNARIALTWSVECSSYVLVRPLTPLTKSLQMLRVIKLEMSRKGEKPAHDAMKWEIVSLSRLKVYYFIDTELLNQLLKRHFNREIQIEDLERALWLLERIGNSESLASPIRVNRLNFRPLGEEGEVYTYTPISWLKEFHEGVKENMLVHLALQRIDPFENPADVFIKRRKKLRWAKKSFLLPLVMKQWGRLFEWYEPKPITVKVAEGFLLIETEDGSKHVLPTELVEG